MQKIEIFRDEENDKFIFINPITRDKTNYDSIKLLVEKEFKQFFMRQNYSDIFMIQIVKNIMRNFVKDNICTLSFPGDLRTGERDNNVDLPDSILMYRD